MYSSPFKIRVFSKTGERAKGPPTPLLTTPLRETTIPVVITCRILQTFLQLLFCHCRCKSTGIDKSERELFVKSSSFHGAMTKKEAELILEQNGNNRCYLVRYCPTEQAHFLSVMTKFKEGQKHHHFELEVTSSYHEKLKIKGMKIKFKNISQLLEHYKKNPVDYEVSNIGVEVQNKHSDESVVSSVLLQYYNNQGNWKRLK